MNKCKSNIVTLSGTLCLTFLLSLFLTSDISLFAFMSAMNVGNDFKISDFYSRVANTFQQNVNEDIVIIDIADCSREQIAETIENIEACRPAAIGVDIIFREKSDSLTDNRLRNAVNGSGNIVLATSADNASGEYIRSSYFSDSIASKGNYGVTNLETTSGLPTGVVRGFRHSYPIKNDTFPSFAALLVEKAFPERYAKHGEKETIYFPGQLYFHHTTEELAQYGKELGLEGKIILLGDYSGSDDLHRTPISEQLSGIEIHAAAISTIMDGKPVKEIPSIWSWLIAIIVCTAILLLKLALQSKKYGAFAVRICQILLIALSVLAGCYIFKELRIVIDINKILLMLLLGLLSMDIWTGIYGFYSDISNRKRNNKN